jgi:hypothetical protein
MEPAHRRHAVKASVGGPALRRNDRPATYFQAMRYERRTAARAGQIREIVQKSCLNLIETCGLIGEYRPKSAPGPEANKIK